MAMAGAAAEAEIAAEAAMAAPTIPSNLPSSRRNAQPIPARRHLRSANRSAGAGTRLALFPPFKQSEAPPRVQTGQSGGRAARWAAGLTNRGARGRAPSLPFVVGGGTYWDVLGCTGTRWEAPGTH